MQVYYFPGSDNASVSDVGGKGYSLINMCEIGLPVPPGAILSVEFFEPWIWAIKHSEEWKRFKKSTVYDLAEEAAYFKKMAASFKYNDDQRMCLEEIYSFFSNDKHQSFFAVRSSSPEEDMEDASFAGIYETVLGVKLEELEEAIQKTFVSCLDERIFTYKKERGFNIYNPQIAVIIQEQVHSDVSGVGFSLNPVNNCYDEAVINSNWGLGEAVVSGQVTPDQFVVDKVNKTIIERTLGAKEMKLSVVSSGGTKKEKSGNASEFALTDEQVIKLTEYLIKIEELYEKPVDLEWAFSNKKLYFLQARPITTYIPIPPMMMTEPDQAKHLYLDITLCIQGLHEPLSVMGEDYLLRLLKQASRELLGDDFVNRNVSPEESLIFCVGGRLYLDVSKIFNVIDKNKYASFFKRMDNIAAETIAALPDGEYDVPLPKCLSNIKSRLVKNIPDTIAKVFAGSLLPSMIEKGYQRKIEQFLRDLNNQRNNAVSFDEFLTISIERLVKLIVHTSIPVIVSAEHAKGRILDLFPKADAETERLLDDLQSSLPGNITVEMGLDLYRLSTCLDGHKIGSAKELHELIAEKKAPVEFLDEWVAFLEKYGFRGPCEIDLAAPRYYEKPDMLLEQIIQYTQSQPAKTPIELFEESQIKRQQAFEKLGEKVHKKGWAASFNFSRLFKIIETFGGHRETHKYFLIKILDMFRSKVIENAQQLVTDDALKNVEDIFKIKIDDLKAFLANPKMDIEKLIFERNEFLSSLRGVKDFPHVIDSRGRILLPPVVPGKKGELAGLGVSKGIVSGPVKVLSHPTEKVICPGDILVTRATDPGWTPLFVNAGAIVLEVGGMLQHGALVAREYGKPCVVGIMGAMEKLKDGQIVEVNGSNGIIKVVAS